MNNRRNQKSDTGLALLAVVVFLSLGISAHAQEAESAWGGWSSPLEYGAFLDILFPTDSKVDTTAQGGGYVGTRLNEIFTVGLQLGVTQWECSDRRIGQVLSVPLLAVVTADIPLNGNLPYGPYVEGGVGIMFNDSDGPIDVDNSFTGRIEAGLRCKISPYFCLHMGLGYLFTDADADLPGARDPDFDSFLMVIRAIWFQ